MKHVYFYVAMLMFSGLYAQEKFSFYFDNDIDTPNAATAGVFENWYVANKNVDIVKIYAYADSVGRPEYNVGLSERRLKNIIKLLRTRKYILNNPDTMAHGEKESAHGTLAENRRVDIFYTKPAPVKQFEQAVSVAKKGEKLKLPGLNFYNNSGRVLRESEPILEELLEILTKNDKLVIQIQGHICCRPGDPDNISELRAKAVYDFLVYNKIDSKRLTYKGFGSSRPIVPLPEMTEEERVMNRRVEIEIIEN